MNEQPLSRNAATDDRAEGLTRVDLLFFAIVALSSMLFAWINSHGTNSDAIAYYDLSTAVHEHRWAACFNASWFPFYPALMAISQAVTGYHPRYAPAATRVLDGLLGVGLIASAVYLAFSVRTYTVRVRGAAAGLLGRSSLAVLMVAFSFYFWSVDMGGSKPDTLLTLFFLLATALLLTGLATGRWSRFLMAGFCAGLAFWAKSFAFPFTGLLLVGLLLTQWRNRRALAQIAAAGVVFLLVIAPYVAGLSRAKGRLTIGDAGRLNSAWYVNGAERLNPVADRRYDSIGHAAGTYKHPAELLAGTPEITFYPPSAPVFGAMPAWDDFSYWSDGLSSRFNPRDSLHALAVDLKQFVPALLMRVQCFAFFVVLAVFGLRWTRRRALDPVLVAVALSCATAILLYLLVHFEGRYIVFAAITLAAIFAGTAEASGKLQRTTLHGTLLALAMVFVIDEMEVALRYVRTELPFGDSLAHARFDSIEYNVGQAVEARYGPHAEVACLGLEACYVDALWSWNGQSRISAVVMQAHRENEATPPEICALLNAAPPETLDRLRKRNVRVIVANFPDRIACSAAWQPIPSAPGYYLLPL